jgi:glycosyltransferase involved in cell wall biosynthesis
MFVTNNPNKYNYNKPDKSGWDLLPSLFNQKGINVLGIGKSDWLQFYSAYKKFKPDLIIIEWIPASFIPLFYKKIKLIKTPILLNWGDCYADTLGRYNYPLLNFLENYVAKNSDYITTVSKFIFSQAEKLGKISGKNLFYIPHGYFKNKTKTKINLNSLKSNPSNLKIIYLGEQTLYKQVDKIIYAVKGLNCDLFLIGNPNPDFQNIAGNNVHFINRIDESEVYSVLNQADILVNTSNMDFAFKLFEYIRIGKPILAYDGMPAFLLTHKENAFLTKNFKEGITELIKNKTLREKLARNVKKIKTFTWDEIADKHIEVYKKILKIN